MKKHKSSGAGGLIGVAIIGIVIYAIYNYTKSASGTAVFTRIKTGITTLGGSISDILDQIIPAAGAVRVPVLTGPVIPTPAPITPMLPPAITSAVVVAPAPAIPTPPTPTPASATPTPPTLLTPAQQDILDYFADPIPTPATSCSIPNGVINNVLNNNRGSAYTSYGDSSGNRAIIRNGGLESFRNAGCP